MPERSNSGQQNGDRRSDSVKGLAAPEAHISFHYPEEKHISVLDALLVIVRYRRLIGLTTLVCFAIGVLLAVLPEESQYRSAATVIRESETARTPSSLGTLSRFGIDFGGTSTGITAQSYPEIMVSREVRLAVARDTFYISRLDSTVRLADYLTPSRTWWDEATGMVKRYTIGLPAAVKRSFQEPAPDGRRSHRPIAADGEGEFVRNYPTPREESVMGVLRSAVSTDIDRQNGLMTIEAVTNDPRLSADLILSFIHHLDERVRAIHTQKARENLQFVEARFGQVEGELRQAEEELAQFMDRNSSMQSARLLTEAERLQRKVNFKAQLYTNLQSQLTQAELELQRSSPIITVLEEPVPPRRPVSSNSSFTILLGLAFGLFLGTGLAFSRWFLSVQETDDEERDKLEEIRSHFHEGSLARRLRAWRGNGEEVSKVGEGGAGIRKEI